MPWRILGFQVMPTSMLYDGKVPFRAGCREVTFLAVALPATALMMSLLTAMLTPVLRRCPLKASFRGGDVEFVHQALELMAISG